jgi:glucose/arabinose dehydrogenase
MKRIVLLAAFLIAGSVSNFGQGVPAAHTIRLQPFINSGLSAPVFMTSPRDGTNRLFIVQQGGIIRVLQPGSTTPTEFLNITTRVLCCGERGLLGLAFHPQYTTNRRFFVYYTRQTDGAIQIAEYQTSVANPNVADTTEKIIITIPHPTFGNHNGGSVVFGPDGYLYAGPGDGGSGNDPNANSQNINQLLGKIIRLDINNIPVNQVPQYNIPPTNPYAGATPGADEIYSIGMRNPYRFSFDRGGTNQLWAADVGQGSIEEVDIITNGGNFGWRVYEGTNCTNLDPQMCAGGTNPINHSPPVFQYSHTGGRCSVTGGHVYRGTLGSLPLGSYVYADYCSGEVFLHNNNQQTVIDATRGDNIVGFGEDESGEIYVIRETGTPQVQKIVRAKASADFDGDLRTDVSVFRPSSGVWYAFHSSNSTVRIQQFGLTGDVPTPEDYDGDNIADIAIYRPTSNAWYYFQSSDSTVGAFNFGLTGDIPTQGDYDGDARADIAIYRPSTGTWWIRRTTSPGSFLAIQFGLSSDVPTAADYDGDGKYDIAVFRPADGDWYRLNSTNGAVGFAHFGLNGDVPTQGDYDGDGLADQAVFRPSTGVWYANRSTSGFFATQWGINTDVPAVGDYDADGRDDIAVFRPSSGVWYASRSTSGVLIVPFGLTGDIPAPRFDTP